MAAGDIFSDTEALLAPLAVVSIQPAAGTQVCITHFWAETTNVQFAGGGTAFTYFGDAGGNSQFANHMASGNPMKILITNSEYINLVNVNAGNTYRYGYCGMEI
jgi:hypothetical protein